VVVYILLAGLPPFLFGPGKHKNIHSLYKEIIFGNIDLDDSIWEIVSKEAKTMMRGILTRDPCSRWSAKDVIECKWMNTSETEKWGSSLVFRSLIFDEQSCCSLQPFEDGTNPNETLRIRNIHPNNAELPKAQDKVILEEQQQKQQQQQPKMQISLDRRQGLTKTPRLVPAGDRMTQVLQLSLSAKGLKNISSLLQTSDPFALVNIRGDNPDNRPVVIGQTNV
jgi:serine/threonine protein kinase